MESNETEIPSNQTSSSAIFNFYRKEQVTFLTTLLFAILVGNSAVLLAIGLSKQKHKSRMNFFIMQLAIADLLVGLISVLTDLIWKITLVWHAGDVMCKLVRYGQAVVIYASTYVLVALTIDRLDAIARPMNFLGGNLRAKLLVGLAWALSGIFSLPMLFVNHVMIGKDGTKQCRIHFSFKWMWQLYLTLIFVVLFIIPAFIIAGCYSAIVYTIWQKTKVIGSTSAVMRVRYTAANAQQPRVCNRIAYFGGRADIKRESSICSRGIIPQAKIKTVKMTFVIVIAFILCWSPFFVFDLMDVYGLVHMEPARLNAVSIFIQSLAPLNSVANPVIFYIFSATIPRNLRRIRCSDRLRHVICCCSRGSGALRRPHCAHPATETAVPNGTTLIMTICDDQNSTISTVEPHTAPRARVYRRQSGIPLIRTQLNQLEREIITSSVNHKPELY